MAFGNVTGYVPTDKPGVYDFEHADGKKLRLFGAPAEELKARIDASAALAPQPVAGPGGAPGVTGNDLVVPEGGFGGFGGQLPGGAQAAPAPPAPEAPPPEAIRAPDEAPQGRSQEPAPFVQKFRNKDGSIVEVQEGTGQTRVYRPGSRGSKGGVQETTSSLTQQGGFDPSQEYLDQKEEAYFQQAAALETGQEAAERAAMVDQAYRREEQRQLELRNLEAEAEARDKAAKVAAYESKYDALEKDFRTSKVDSNRHLASFGGILGALGASLGAMASTATGTPNFALNVLQTRIADDIKAQETALNVKRDSRDNMLGVLNRELGSMDLAKKALEGVRLRQSKAHFDSLAAAAKTEKEKAQHMAMAAGLGEKYADFREQYRVSADGQITKAKNFQNVPGTAGSAAGYDLPTSEDLGNVQKLTAKAEAKQERAVPHATAEDITKAAKALAQAARLEKILGGQKAGLHGEELDDPEKGPVDSLQFRNKDIIHQETRRAAQAFQDARGKSDMDAVLATQDAIGSGSLASRKRAVESLRREMSQQLKSSLAGIPPEQAQRMIRSVSPEALEQYTRALEEPQK